MESPCSCPSPPPLNMALCASPRRANLVDPPVLHSRPSSTKKLYLAMNGYFNPYWGGYTNITTPPYDGDSAAWTEIWARVAEDYAPFDIDVTTEAYTEQNGVVAIIAIGGSYSDWYGGAVGGVAYVGGFYNLSPGVGYVFATSLSNYPKYIAEAAAHEAGHLFGLQHQARWSGESLAEAYNSGNGEWAPIMGVGYSATRTTWYNGPTAAGPSSSQDDMSILSGPYNGFGYVTEDYADTNAAALPIPASGSTINFSALIKTGSDKDIWSITTSGGVINLTLTVSTYHNLDSILELHDSGDNVLVTSAPGGDYNATISTTVSAGTYYLIASSNADYGDCGQYTLSGTIDGLSGFNETGSGGAGLSGNATVTYRANISVSSGIALNGIATIVLTANPSVSSGTALNGTAIINLAIFVSGGVYVGGIGIVSFSGGINEYGSGGSGLNGNATVSLIRTISVSSGIGSNATATITIVANPSVSSGIALNGNSIVALTVAIGGGSLTAGNCVVTYVANAFTQSGALSNGLSTTTSTISISASGGTLCSGSGTSAFALFGSGVSSLSGTAIVSITYSQTVSSGSVCNGLSNFYLTFNKTTSSGMVCGDSINCLTTFNVIGNSGIQSNGIGTIVTTELLALNIEFVRLLASQPVTVEIDYSHLISSDGYIILTEKAGGLKGAIDRNISILRNSTNWSVMFDLYSDGEADAIWFNAYSSIVPISEKDNGYQVFFTEYGAGHSISGVGIAFDGVELDFVAYDDLGDATWRTAKIDYDNGHFQIYLNDSLIIDYTDLTIRDLSGSHLGLGARTGSYFAEHRVRQLEITSYL